MAERIIIKNTQSPGDLIVLTAAIRDISLAYPDKFEFMVNTSAQQVFAHNPYCKSFPKNGVREIKANYPLIHTSNQERRHFIWGFLEDLNKQLGVNAPLTELRPDLHLSEAEKEPFKDIPRPYWVMVSGGKLDFTAKWWHPKYWQKTVNELAKERTIVQVGNAGHQHPRLKNVKDMVGKTTLRDLFRLIYHSEGVLCVVTCLAHIAAAFNKNCVILAGGREPWWWEAYTAETRRINVQYSTPGWKDPNDGYVSQKYLHTMGRLPCCQDKGCWKSHVGKHRGSLCTAQVVVENIHLPRCMQMITPDTVIQAFKDYLKGSQQPVTETTTAISLPEVYTILDAEFTKSIQEIKNISHPWVLFSQRLVQQDIMNKIKKETLGVDALGCWYRTPEKKFAPNTLLYAARTEHVKAVCEKGLPETSNELSGRIGTYLQEHSYTCRDIGSLIITTGT